MLNLFLVELKRLNAIFLRYPVEAIAGTALSVGFFLALVLGARFISGQGAAWGGLDAAIAGYFCWTLVSTAISSAPSDVQMEAQAGTIEALFQNAHGMPALFAVRSLASLAHGFLFSVAVLGIVLVVTGHSFTVSGNIVPPLFALCASAIGIGLSLGALAMRLKRIHVLMAGVNLLLLPLLLSPLGSLHALIGPAYYAIPMLPAAGALKAALAGGPALPWDATVLLLGPSLAFALAGLGVFALSATRARQLGIVSHS